MKQALQFGRWAFLISVLSAGSNALPYLLILIALYILHNISNNSHCLRVDFLSTAVQCLPMGLDELNLVRG